MANSGYYYGLYTKYKNEVKDYEKYITKLQNIKGNLTGDFYDEQRNVNSELQELSEDLSKAVRHDSAFNSSARISCSYEEKSTTVDGKLDGAVTALENEIGDLQNKKRTAEQNRDSNYQRYQTEKQKEHQEWLESLKKLVTG